MSTENNTANVIKKGNRGKSWSVKEDAVLCEAWVSVSNDPRTGTSQAPDQLWNMIVEEFHKRLNPAFKTDHRTKKAMKNRWGIIKASCILFSESVTEALECERSEASDFDEINEARRIYRSKEKTSDPFVLMHCWNILQNEVKWQEILHEKKKKDMRNEETRVISFTKTEASEEKLLSDCAISKAKRGNEEMTEGLATLQKQLYDYREKKMKLAQEAMDLKIMAVDTLAMTEDDPRRAFFRERQEEVMKRFREKKASQQAKLSITSEVTQSEVGNSSGNTSNR